MQRAAQMFQILYGLMAVVRTVDMPRHENPAVSPVIGTVIRHQQTVVDCNCSASLHWMDMVVNKIAVIEADNEYLARELATVKQQFAEQMSFHSFMEAEICALRTENKQLADTNTILNSQNNLLLKRIVEADQEIQQLIQEKASAFNCAAPAVTLGGALHPPVHPMTPPLQPIQPVMAPFSSRQSSNHCGRRSQNHYSRLRSKTEFCKHIRMGKRCRHGGSCAFAHSHDELAA